MTTQTNPNVRRISLGALKDNYTALRSCLPEGTKLIAVLKADAYGHGLLPAAKALADAGADMFAVALADEGVALRESGVTLPVLVLGPVMGEGVQQAVRKGLIMTVCTPESVQEIDRACDASGCEAQVHVKIDTGMKAERFIALHLSGGTTESLLVENGEITLIGGSNDLHAGQFVDRAGVTLGLPFPCGPHMEQLAQGGHAVPLLKLAHRDGWVSFSGAETQIQRMVAEGSSSPEDIAMEVYHYIARAVAQIIIYAHEQTGAKDILLAGGVASSLLLRDLLAERLRKKKVRVRLHWAKPQYAGDNACGVALLGLEEYLKSKES